MRTVHSCQNNIHRIIAGTITRGSCNIFFAMGLSFYSVIVKCFPFCMFVCILHPSIFGVLAVFWQRATIISSFDDDDIRPKRRHSMKYQNENDQRKTHTQSLHHDIHKSSNILNTNEVYTSHFQQPSDIFSQWTQPARNPRLGETIWSGTGKKTKIRLAISRLYARVNSG